MRKFLALAAMVLGLASCQTEPEGLDVNMGDGTTTISVVLPEEAITRAGGTDSAASGLDNVSDEIVRVVMHIYDENGNVSEKRYVDYLGEGETTVNFDVRLVPNRKYTFVAWADQVDDKADVDKYFNTEDLAKVTIIEDTWTAMNEGRDAFTATHTEANYTSSSNITLKLTRPFAKLRVVTTDMAELGYLGITPATAEFAYTVNVPTSFNAFTGEIGATSEKKSFTYDIAKYSADAANTKTLFSDYLFVPADGVVKFTLNVYEDSEKTKLIKSNNFNTDIPVKRNNLTTLKGNILTDGGNITVTIDPALKADDPDTNYGTISSIKELQDAVNNGGNYIVISNIFGSSSAGTLAATRTSNGGKTTTINLNGYTITFEEGAQVTIPEGNTLIIKDEPQDNGEQGAIVAEGDDSGIVNNGTLNIEGGSLGEGTIENGDNGKVNISGGNHEAGAVKNENGEVIITGDGIEDSVVAGDVTNYVTGLVEAFANGGEYTLGASVELTEPLKLAKGNTLNLTIAEGAVLSIVDTTEKNFALITTQGNLTIDGAGKLTLKSTINSGRNRYSSVISNTVGGNLTVKGVTIEHLGGTDMAYAIDNLTNGKGTYAVTIVDGATVKSPYRAIRQFLNGVEATNELQVKNSSVIEGANKSVWMHDPNKNANTGKLVVEPNAQLKGNVYLSVTAGSTEWPINVSVAKSALVGESKVTTSDVPEGYTLEEKDGVYYVASAKEAMIGTTSYATLQEAINAAQNKETIVLLRDVEQVDGILIENKNLTVNLNGYTYTVSEGASTNNRNFKITGTSVVTIKNGTMVAAGEITSGAYGTVRTEGTANVTLENVKLYSYRGYGLNVKANTGTTINIKDSEIYSQYSGGVEAAGGTIELTNVKIEQTGVYSSAAWCSVAIGVNGGGKVTVNSGDYYAATIASDSNAAQGTWVAYVMNSGGTLDIKGGTFTGVIAETAAAANACGLICADTKAVVNIYDGVFNSNGAILDMRNNTGGYPNPAATLYGGDFSADPRVSGLGASNLIYVADGKEAYELNGRYVVGDICAAKIDSVRYDSLQAAFDAVNNETIVLCKDITILEPATLAAGKSAVLDLNGKTLTAELASALVATEGAHLTVKNGNVIAYESTIRAIGGTVVVESGEYTSTGTALDSPATYRYSLDCREGGELIVNGGTFMSNNGMLNVGSTMIINGGKFDNRIEKVMTRHMAYVSAPLTINGGEFYGEANGAAGGCFFCGAAAGCEINITDGKFTSLWTSGSANRIFEVYYGGTINVSGGLFNTNGGITGFVEANTDAATKDAYPYVAKQ